jgi:hypothetical protein
MAGPVPSNLVLLADLAECAPGTKVRFLGWYCALSHKFTSLTCDSVDKYLVKTAILRLIHHYPASDPPTVANVDVELVLESIKPHELDVGTWINVIGHVERCKEKGVFVQAIAVWDAGNINLDAYHNVFEKRREAG